jgi:hypothetical protein
MAIVKSLRAQRLLERPQFIKEALETGMTKYPGSPLVLWARVELEKNLVKNLSLYGEFEDHQKVLFESMASLLIGGPITRLDELSVRECEAYLRDRNSEVSIEEMSETQEEVLKSAFKWIRLISQSTSSQDYIFSSEKGPFHQLKLVEKIKELKAFLRTPEILTLYQDLPLPELVDVDELTVYIHAPYGSQREKEQFSKLHALGVLTFKDENLNFIPEDL